MPELRDQLRSYVEETIERVDVEDVAAAVEEPRPKRSVATTPALAFGVAAAAFLIVIGGTAWLLRGNGSTPADETPATSVPTTTVVEQALPTITLQPVAGAIPVTMSTSLGTFEFVTMKFPDGHSFDFPFHSAAATPYGPVSVGDSKLWWSPDYLAWNQTTFAGDSDRIVLDGQTAVVLRGGGAARLAWDGNRWAPEGQIEVPGQIEWIEFGPQGIVAASPTTIYNSSDGVRFTEAESGPDLATFVASDVNPENEEFVEAARMDCRGTFGAAASQIRALLATDSGFVAFTSAIHPAEEVCSPLLWFSPDGSSWDLVSEASPFGQAAVAVIDPYSIAEHDGRFVAVGSIEAQMEGFVWVSDDALTWQQADVRIASPLMVEAGEMGWVLVASTAPPEAASDFGLWFSPDGSMWDGPHPLPEGLLAGYMVPELVVGSDAIFGVGFDEEIFVVGRLQEVPGGH